MPSLRSDSVSTAGSSASSEVVDECAKAKLAASAETEAAYSTTAPCGSASAMCAAQVFGASACLDGRCPAKTASVSAVQTASGLANSAPLTAPSGNALIPMRSIRTRCGLNTLRLNTSARTAQAWRSIPTARRRIHSVSKLRIRPSQKQLRFWRWTRCAGIPPDGYRRLFRVRFQGKRADSVCKISVVQTMRLELIRLAPLPPQDSVSTSSTTSAHLHACITCHSTCSGEPLQCSVYNTSHLFLQSQDEVQRLCNKPVPRAARVFRVLRRCRVLRLLRGSDTRGAAEGAGYDGRARQSVRHMPRSTRRRNAQ